MDCEASINPYTPPSTDSLRQSRAGTRSNRIAVAAWLFLYCYPILAVGSIYVCWLFAWIALGHLPQEMLNDPKFLGGPSSLAYIVSVLLFVIWPIMGVGGLIATGFCPIQSMQRRRFVWLQLAAVYLFMTMLTVALIYFDPGRVIAWWMD